MKILLVGSGGREHALAWKIRQSRHCTKLFVAPGNAGTSLAGENISIAVDEFEKIGAFCVQENIELVVVGPEVPLVKGIRDYFENSDHLKNILLVGPGKKGAQLEGSKDFSKQFMVRHNIPSAKSVTFYSHELKAAQSYLQNCSTPIVLKADGLAAGKGVIITSLREEAIALIEEMFVQKKFGEASSKVLIEEFLEGIELSVFVLTDGKNYVILPEAKDYKRIGDGDTGPNTGGMGSVSPVTFADKEFMDRVEQEIIKPTIRGLNTEKIDYRGFIFIGLMNVKGKPFVIEYNARMGDPETQSVMPRIKNDFVELLVACAKGELKNKYIDIDPSFALTVVMAAGGYPDQHEKGKVIFGLSNQNNPVVFHAGTVLKNENVVTNGGRVLTITATANSLREAQQLVYERIRSIQWDGAYYRKDIGNDLMNLANNAH